MDDSALSKLSAENALGIVIPDLYFGIARAISQGMSPENVAKVYGYPIAEIIELMKNEDFLRIKAWYATTNANLSLDADDNWDSLEEKAITNLGKVAKINMDPDFNLKLATIANRAQRRHRSPGSSPLDPTQAGQVVNVSFHKRFVKVLADGGYEKAEVIIEGEGLSQYQQAELGVVSDLLGVSDKRNMTLADPDVAAETLELDRIVEDGVIDAG